MVVVESCGRYRRKPVSAAVLAVTVVRFRSKAKKRKC